VKLSLLTLPALAATLMAAGCGGSNEPTIQERAAELEPAKTASKLKADLERRGHDVQAITCDDVSSTSQACAGTVDGKTLEWTVTIDLATGQRDVKVKP
jgi:hypothetical protein